MLVSVRDLGSPFGKLLRAGPGPFATHPATVRFSFKEAFSTPPAHIMGQVQLSCGWPKQITETIARGRTTQVGTETIRKEKNIKNKRNK